jgi:hypothetical protein
LHALPILTRSLPSLVVAVRDNNSATQPYLFRTYEHLSSSTANPLELNPGLANNVPIWEVARATTAAPTFFKPIFIGNEKFLDGGYGIANNPTWHALQEVGQMNANSPDSVALIVSIGTGKPDKVRPTAKHGATLVGHYRAMFKYAAAAITDSENTHLKMQGHYQHSKHRYERFNVDGGLGNIDLGEWKTLGGRNLTLEKIRQQTRSYLDRAEVRKGLERAAEILVKARQERSRTKQWSIVATGLRYRCPEDRCPSTPFMGEEDLRMHLAERHSALGYVWPANTHEERTKMASAVRDGKIPYAD